MGSTLPSNSINKVCLEVSSINYENTNSNTSFSNKQKALPIPPTTINPLNLDESKTKCKELGFKEKTPDFGNCVLQLNEAK